MSEYVEIIEAISLSNRSELLGLYADSSCDSLCPNLEALLEEHPNDPVIKLLWCDAQATGDRLPLPFVASTLLDVFEARTAQNIHPRLSFLVTQRLTQLLIEKGEFRTAIFLASDFILKGNAKYFKNKEEFSDLKSTLLNILDEEISQAVKRREPATYRTSLEDTKLQIKQAKPPSRVKDKTSAIEANSKTILTVPKPNNSQNDEFVIGNIDSLNANGSDAEFEVVPSRSDNAEPTYSKVNKSIFLIVCVVFAGLMSLYLYKETSLFNQFSLTSAKTQYDIDNQLIFETQTDGLFKPEYPSIKPFSLDNFRTSLDDINVRLAKLTKRDKPDLSVDHATAGNEDKSKNVKEDLSAIESLNTVPDLAEPPTQAAPLPKLPEIPDNIGKSIDLNNGTVPSRSNQNPVSNSRSIPSSIKTNPDGRVFGPPAISDPTNGSKNQQALDGSALQSYEVERYDQPQVYETITATNVLVAPSLLSQSITRLKSETPIHVTAKMGLWLELMSNEGKIGYIFAQDAEKK